MRPRLARRRRDRGERQRRDVHLLRRPLTACRPRFRAQRNLLSILRTAKDTWANVRTGPRFWNREAAAPRTLRTGGHPGPGRSEFGSDRESATICLRERGADKLSSGLGDPLSETTEWGLCGALPGEPVPDSRHRVDVRRLLRVRLDFATQPVDVRVDRASLDLDLVSPDAAEQLSAAHDLTGA
jgi:hypothetical protein